VAIFIAYIRISVWQGFLHPDHSVVQPRHETLKS
jgi:hypothetical protein